MWIAIAQFQDKDARPRRDAAYKRSAVEQQVDRDNQSGDGVFLALGVLMAKLLVVIARFIFLAQGE